MKLAELQQLRPLEALIEQEIAELEELRAAAGVQGARLDGMPRAPGHRDKIGVLVPEIIDRESELIETLQLYIQRAREIRAFINSIPDLRIKLICILRFEKGLTWEGVADGMGVNASSYACKNALYRYFRRLEKES